MERFSASAFSLHLPEVDDGVPEGCGSTVKKSGKGSGSTVKKSGKGSGITVKKSGKGSEKASVRPRKGQRREGQWELRGSGKPVQEGVAWSHPTSWPGPWYVTCPPRAVSTTASNQRDDMQLD